jgi:hypothetical protein
MKQINLIVLIAFLSLSAIIVSCKKKKEDPQPTGPTCSTLLTSDTIVYSGSFTGTDIKKYTYNSSKKLVKIEYIYLPNTAVNNYDTIVYVGGNISTVQNFNTGNPTPNSTNTYTYTSGQLTSVHEVGDNGAPFDRTRTFTYTSGVLSSMVVTYTSGASNGEPDNLTNITFTSGNITSADLGVSMGGPATIVYDVTGPNPYLGMNNDSEDIIKMFSANNATSAYSNIAPGSPFFTNSYTYSNGRVRTITETDGTDTQTHTLTYTCL